MTWQHHPPYQGSRPETSRHWIRKRVFNELEKGTEAVKGDWETNRRDDLPAFQDQRYRRFRLPDNGAQGRQRADLRHEMGRGPSSRNKSSQMKSLWRILYFKQLEKSDQLKPLVALWIHDIRMVNKHEPALGERQANLLICKQEKCDNFQTDLCWHPSGCICHKKGDYNKSKKRGFLHFENENQGDEKRTRGERPSQLPLPCLIWVETPRKKRGRDPAQSVFPRNTTKIKVEKFQISKEKEAQTWVRDKNPTRGVVRSSPENERIPHALLCSEREDCEDWSEYLAEEARVKAWKLHKEIY